jgi:hypothetical protein
MSISTLPVYWCNPLKWQTNIISIYTENLNTVLIEILRTSDEWPTSADWSVCYVACKRQDVCLPMAHDRLRIVLAGCSLMSLRAFCRNGQSCVLSRQPKHTNAKRNTIYYYYYCVRYPFKITIDVWQARTNICRYAVSEYAMLRLKYNACINALLIVYYLLYYIKIALLYYNVNTTLNKFNFDVRTQILYP